MTTSSRALGRALFLGAAILVTAVPATSAAQPSTPSAADLESARELFKQGRELRNSGDLRRALERFKAAHTYAQTPVTALELGRTHIQLGELVEGREVLLSVARLKPQTDETDKSAAARTEAAALAEEAKRRIPTLTIRLTGVATDSTTQLTVDGAPGPVVGLSGVRKVNPGAHVVVARVGAHEQTKTVELEEGKTQEVALDLAGAVPAGGGGAVTGPGQPPPGAREISPVTWIGLGVAGVGLGVGTVTGVIALGKASKVKDACTSVHCPSSAQSDVSAGRTAATVSTLGFLVGGAGLVTAAVGYFVLSKPKATAGAVHVTPFVSAGAVGLDGSF